VIVVTATDTRGVGSGWTLSLAADGDFRDAHDSFPLTNFSLQAGSVQGKDNAIGITPFAIGNVSCGAQSVMVLARSRGLGVFDDTINGTIKVPDGTFAADGGL